MDKILLVDDVKLLLELQKRFLASSRVQIFTAHDGFEALEVARRELPQLIVMDKYMPNMDGLTCCREIKRDPDLRHIPVVMVSNAAHADEVEEFRGMGVDAYLPKPLEGKQFLDTIKRYISSIERRSPRVPCRVTVRLICDSVTHAGVSEDLGTGGIYVATGHPFSRGDELLLSFLLPGCDAPIEARGRVAWVNRGDSPAKPALSPGIGIEFIQITGSGMTLVRTGELKSFIAAASDDSLRSHPMN